jgi:hypothetical protein
MSFGTDLIAFMIDTLLSIAIVIGMYASFVLLSILYHSEEFHKNGFSTNKLKATGIIGTAIIMMALMMCVISTAYSSYHTFSVVCLVVHIVQCIYTITHICISLDQYSENKPATPSIPMKDVVSNA